MPKSYSDLAARIRVPLGLVLGVVYIVFSRPTPQRLVWGAVIAFAGLLLRAAGAGYLAKNQALATSGPYSYTRHPLYLGSMLAGVGYCIAGGQWWFFVLLAVFLGAVYWPVIRKEEAHLSEIFPEEYGKYARAVPFLIPRPTGWVPAASQRFSWSRYKKNREYQAFFAFLAIVFVLVLKLLV
jgi:protein-S-isoprenylcysteine O-methyltransferase Ste14